MRSRSTSRMQHSPVRLSLGGASATRSRPPEGRSGCVRMSRRRGSRRGRTGRREPAWVPAVGPRGQWLTMNLDLTDEESAARYLMSPRIKTLKAIRAKIRPEPVRAVASAAEAICTAAGDSEAETAGGTLSCPDVGAVGGRARRRSFGISRASWFGPSRAAHRGFSLRGRDPARRPISWS